MSARFEVVQTDAGWTARFRASNGPVVMSSGSQVYTRKANAHKAIRSVARAFSPIGEASVGATAVYVALHNDLHGWADWGGSWRVPIVEVDERTQPTEGNATNGSGVVVVDG